MKIREWINNLLNKIPNSVKKSILEILRWFVLGLASLYVLNSGEFDLAWALKTMSLRIVDKLIHIYGKDEDISWLIKGLTRF